MYTLVDDHGQILIRLPIKHMAEHLENSNYPPWYGVRGVYHDIHRKVPRIKTIQINYFELLWSRRN